MEDKSPLLIVDDDPTNIKLIQNILGRLNKYTVFTATNGKDALNIIKNNTIALVLLDIIMPDMDGYEVAVILQSHPVNKKIPIIFLTANSQYEDIKKGFECGAKDYITKPFNLQELIARVDTHIELFNSRNKLEEQLNENISLLEQYKKVVDESDIVSKTDTKGIITYVNKKFIEISGYTKEELIGQSHNIVRHPDTPKETFQDLWKRIKSKKVWKGEFKNLKKNGDYYVVESIIVPILDTHDNIVEYMSVIHDITEIYNFSKEIENTQKEVVLTLGAVCENRSQETSHHVVRVAAYSYLLAKLYGLEEWECQLIKNASPMHDIGKVAIIDDILNKPSILTKEEFEIVKTHAVIGYEILKYSQRPILKAASIIALEHHEKYDGSGYPGKKRGEDIHIYGRITALADVFDALITKRIYKEVWELDRVIKFLKKEAGKHFDPNLVCLFLDNLEDFLEIKENFPQTEKQRNTLPKNFYQNQKNLKNKVEFE